MKKSDPKLEAIWRKHLQDWKASGLSQAKFAEQNGINRWNFAYWKKRIQKIDDATIDKLVPIKVDRIPSRHNLDNKISLAITIDTGIQIQVNELPLSSARQFIDDLGLWS